MMLNWLAEFDQAHGFWVILASVLLLLTLIPGVILLYLGLFRQADLPRQLVRWLLLAASGSVAWNLLLYSLSFAPSYEQKQELPPAPMVNDLRELLEIAANTEDTTHLLGRGGFIGGLDYAGFHSLTPEGNPSEPLFAARRPYFQLPHVAFQFLQMMVFLAAICALATLLSLSLRWPLVLSLCLLWGAVVYAPMAHWVWGEGWLAMRGAVDFGGGLLHLTLGFSALAVLLCSRAAESPHTASATPAQSPDSGSLSAGMGLILFWIGSLILQATFRIEKPVIQSVALFNSHLAGSTGCLMWCFLSWLRGRQFDVADVIAGSLAGLATIAGGCGLFVPSSALITSLAGSAAAYAALVLCGTLQRQPFAALMFAAQGVPAALGLILVGLFGYQNFGVKRLDQSVVAGLIDGDSSQLLIQAGTVAAVAAWATCGTALLILPAQIVARRITASTGTHVTVEDTAQ